MRKMGTPLRIIFNCRLSALLKPLPDGTYLLDPCLPPLYLQRQLAGKPNRRFPFYLPGSILSVHRTTLRLGDGYRLKGDPAKMSRLIERPFAVFVLNFRREAAGNAIEIFRFLAIYPMRLAPGDFAALNSFCREVDEANQKFLVVEKVERSGNKEPEKPKRPEKGPGGKK